MYAESWNACRDASRGLNLVLFAKHLCIKSLNFCKASLPIIMERLQSFLICTDSGMLAESSSSVRNHGMLIEPSLV